MLTRQVLYSNDVYEVYGESGWENFDGVVVTEGNFHVVHITTKSGNWIKCTRNHILYNKKNKEILAGNIQIGDYIQTKDGISRVTKISAENVTKVFDIWNSESHKVYTNGIKNHQCDELAFVRPSLADAFWTANYPALAASKESKVIAISTPNGLFNLYHTLYEKARSKEEYDEYSKVLASGDKEKLDAYIERTGNKNKFVKAKYNWRVVPGRDDEWAESEKANVGDIKFTQEYECVAGETKVYTNRPISIAELFEELRIQTKEDESATFVSNSRKITISTPAGQKPFKGIRKISVTDEETKHKRCIKIHVKGLTSEPINIIVSEHHTFMLGDMRKQAGTLKPGDTLQHKKYGMVKVLQIEEVERCDLYDIVGIKDIARYFTNDLVSHNCDFLGSTATLVNPRTLERLLRESIVPPILIDLDNRLRVYEKPIEYATYVIGVDPAKGTGKHDSCAHVLKIQKLKPFTAEQVAVFQSNTTDAYEFAKILQRLGIYYNNAYLLVENNAEGSAVIHNLWWGLEYENLYCEARTKTGMGIRATNRTKSKAVLLMKRFLEEKNIILHDEATIVQLSTYIETDDGKYSGQQGQPDDLVSALHWAVYSAELNLFDEDVEIIKKDIDDEVGWGILTDIGSEEDFSYYDYRSLFS